MGAIWISSCRARARARARARSALVWGPDRLRARARARSGKARTTPPLGVVIGLPPRRGALVAARSRLDARRRRAPPHRRRRESLQAARPRVGPLPRAPQEELPLPLLARRAHQPPRPHRLARPQGRMTVILSIPLSRHRRSPKGVSQILRFHAGAWEREMRPNRSFRDLSPVTLPNADSQQAVILSGTDARQGCRPVSQKALS